MLFMKSGDHKGSMGSLKIWTLSQTTNLRLFETKLKEFADDSFNSDENGRKFFKRIENTVSEREIARFEQFLLFPIVFLKDCRHLKTWLVLHHFEIFPNLKNLQTTSDVWLLKDFKIQIAEKTLQLLFHQRGLCYHRILH